jgi:putative endonuclease
MYYVYLIKSSKDETLYVGCTSNLKRRLEEHNKNMSVYTKKYGPWKLIYFEAFLSKEDAYGREGALKSHAQGLRRLKERLSSSLR